MHFPRLTVIIPTIERPDTIYWTLRTVLEQDYDNFSIIVSDNFSNDNTYDVVKSFNSSKITYINPGKRLSMSHHFEFALDHVDAGYVTILGDDDGLLKGGLRRVAEILSKHEVEALGWRFGNFNWKGLPPYFMIPMGNCYRKIDAKKEICKVFKQSIYNTVKFPSFYGGFVQIDLFKRLKKKYGTFFHSRIPDFFSGGLIASSVPDYIRAEFPITINATSKHSTGYATINTNSDQKAFIDLQKQDNNIPFHKDLIFIRSNAVPIADAMLQVHELDPDFPRVEIKKMLEEIVREAVGVRERDKYEHLVQGVKDIAKINGLEDFSNTLLSQAVHKPVVEFVKNKFSPVSNTLYVDTTETDIATVYDACNFASEVIPQKYFELRGAAGDFVSRLAATGRYLSLKCLSDKRKTL